MRAHGCAEAFSLYLRAGEGLHGGYRNRDWEVGGLTVPQHC